MGPIELSKARQEDLKFTDLVGMTHRWNNS